MRRVRVAVVAVEMQLSITYSECVFVALVIQQAKRMRCIILSHLWPAPLYHIFPHYLINGTIFCNIKLLNTKCVFGFSVQLLNKRFSWQEESNEVT